jgi:predicted metalloprotease
MWAGQATSTDDASGEPLITDLTEQDIQEAVAAAKAVGDDRIQQASTGRVDPEGWTHGSAEQRVRWFMTGYEQGSMQACDTFSASSL